MLTAIGSYINLAILFGTVVMFGALGEILTEKTGHLNLGTPGIVYLGGFGGWLGSFLAEKVMGVEFAPLLVIIAIVFSVLFAAIGGLIYAFFTVTLRCNQNVTGLALTFLGVGVCSFGGQYTLKTLGFSGTGKAVITSDAFTWCLNIQLKLGGSESNFVRFIGDAFLGYGFLVFVAIAIAIIMHLILKKTNVGLSLRSIGENPATADAQGINVTKYKYFGIVIGAAIAGLGGLTYVMNYSSGIWSTANNIEALGWLSVALVIFATWRPLNAIWGSYLFAFLYWLYNYVNSLFGLVINQQQQYALQMLPYVITIIVLIIVSLRKKKELQPPNNLGVSYFREDR